MNTNTIEGFQIIGSRYEKGLRLYKVTVQNELVGQNGEFYTSVGKKKLVWQYPPAEQMYPVQAEFDQFAFVPKEEFFRNLMAAMNGLEERKAAKLTHYSDMTNKYTDDLNRLIQQVDLRRAEMRALATNARELLGVDFMLSVKTAMSAEPPIELNINNEQDNPLDVRQHIKATK